MRRRCDLVAADEHAVGAVVRDDPRRRGAAAFGRCLLLEEGVDHAHDFAGRGVLQVMMSTSSSPCWSMRWMMRITRLTLLARSEMISMLPAG